jgi:hypothetical protein
MQFKILVARPLLYMDADSEVTVGLQRNEDR